MDVELKLKFKTLLEDSRKVLISQKEKYQLIKQDLYKESLLSDPTKLQPIRFTEDWYESFNKLVICKNLLGQEQVLRLDSSRYIDDFSRYKVIINNIVRGRCYFHPENFIVDVLNYDSSFGTSDNRIHITFDNVEIRRQDVYRILSVATLLLVQMITEDMLEKWFRKFILIRYKFYFHICIRFKTFVIIYVSRTSKIAIDRYIVVDITSVRW